MIKVCDAIMGSGKTSAAITYMNENRKEKFIYVTPYLDEAKRIKEACPKLKFVEPSNKIKEYGFRKRTHTAELIREGKNIATTHQAFRRYTQEMLDDIAEQGYRLIIDESIDILERVDMSLDDLEILKEAGRVVENNGVVTSVGKEYRGNYYRDLFEFLEFHELIVLKDATNTQLFYWILPPKLVRSFSEVIVLTYLFEGQSLHHFFDMYKFDYRYIGVERVDGTFRFCDEPGTMPEYVHSLKDKIHIIGHPKSRKGVNSVGDDYHALSVSWFKTHEEEVLQLKRNLSNVMRNHWRGVEPGEKMWSTYKDQQSVMTGKGYLRSFVPFNIRATNEYRDRTHIAYLVNLYMNVGEKMFYRAHGIDSSDNAYALSVMVQWLWRSAIRDGKDVYLYMPSARMRKLLNDWMNEITKGGKAIVSK